MAFAIEIGQKMENIIILRKEGTSLGAPNRRPVERRSSFIFHVLFYRREASGDMGVFSQSIGYMDASPC
jgi:hypothetical protein